MKDDLTLSTEQVSGKNVQLESYEKVAGLFARWANAHGGDEEEALTDLLVDLHHLADNQGLDWQSLIDRADMHHSHESDDDDPDDDDSEAHAAGEGIATKLTPEEIETALRTLAEMHEDPDADLSAWQRDVRARVRDHWRAANDMDDLDDLDESTTEENL